MQPLKITANLANGFIASDPWSPTIDGILAYWYMREKLGADEFAWNSAQPHVMEPVTGLPLEVCSHEDLWWYACSSPIYHAHAQVKRFLQRRFDDAQERYLDLSGKSGKILVAGGPYKNARNQYVQTVTNAIVWHAVGDAQEVRRLLAKCTHVGAKTGAGFGRVRSWAVTEDGDAEAARTHRPLPAQCAPQRKQMLWGLKPPARLERILCGMP